MAEITLTGITKRFEGDVVAVDAVDLDIADGEFVVLVGPSGCGKSTLLRIVAGLEQPDAGSIAIGGRDVTRLQPKDRDIAMVFQSYALYSHRTVHGNIAYPLKLAGLPKAEIEAKVQATVARAPPRGAARPATGPAVGRAAPAGGHGPRPGAPAQGLPDGRTPVQPRRQAAGRDAGRDRPAPALHRGHHALRDPRPGRGHDHGRPGRRHSTAAGSSRSAPPRSSTTSRRRCSWPPSSGRRP